MLLRDIIHLGHLQIASAKVRNLFTIISIGILFSLLFTIQFVLNGLYHTLFIANKQLTGDYTYLISQDYQTNFDDEGNTIDTYREDRIANLANKYHGEIIGHARLSTHDDVFLIPDTLLPNFPWASLSNQQPGSIPIALSSKTIELLQLYSAKFSDIMNGTVMPPEWLDLDPSTRYARLQPLSYAKTLEIAQQFNHQNLDITDATLYIIRVSPDHSISLPENNIINPLNYPLHLTEGFNMIKTVIFTNSNLLNAPLIADNISSISLPIVRFQDPNQAYLYQTELNQLSSGKSTSHTNSYHLFGNQTNIVAASKSIDKTFFILELILIVIAIIIMSFTFIHLIHQQANTIALYRTLGATHKDLILIQLSYLIELCLCTLIFAIISGLFLSLLISLANNSELAKVLINNYMTTPPGFIMLFGFGWQIPLLSFIILLTPLPVILLTIDQFSPKNLSKHLKSD